MAVSLVSSAQDLKVRSFDINPMDATARTHPRTSPSGVDCAVVKVYLPLKGADFDSEWIVDEPTYRSGIYTLYMPEGARKLIIMHDDFHPLEVYFKNVNPELHTLQGNTVYILIIDLPEGYRREIRQSSIPQTVQDSTSTNNQESELNENSSSETSSQNESESVLGQISPNEPENTDASQSLQDEQDIIDFPLLAQDQTEISDNNLLDQKVCEYVDLGLSVKWATCNVGALSPEEYGDYYAWGELEPKTRYNWNTYKWCNDTKASITKYCVKSADGKVDNKKHLDLKDDIAHVKWGGKWRMPTKAEQDELRKKCTWTWTTQGGKNGYRITSNKNGNSIFLPAAGYCYNSALCYDGVDGSYWSSTIDTTNSGRAWLLDFNTDDNLEYGYYRYFGHNIRPVCP